MPVSSTDSPSRSTSPSIEAEESIESGQPSPALGKREFCSRPWCHTVGRISCIARVIPYGIGIAYQSIKTLIKIIFSSVQLFFNLVKSPLVLIYNIFADCQGKSRINYFGPWFHHSWSFEGVARDGLALVNLAQRLINSVWLTVVAPPSEYRSMKEVFSSCFSVSVLGAYHGTTIDPNSIKKLWENTFYPNYFRQISPCLRQQDSTIASSTNG